MTEGDEGAARRHADTRAEDYRYPYDRDCDRLLYSSAFRRLSGITQVVSADETQLFHNRLTHSLKVAQIARRLSEKLVAQHKDEFGEGFLVPAAAEAAARAHDLGHPPFGHIAENVLCDRCDEAGINGYEGNAQSFRIVTKLAWRSREPGLNLTRRTLRALLKYPWMRAEKGTDDVYKRKKWGAYETERQDFHFAMEWGEPDQRSLEAEIMDLADDITYAVHDLEDFYRAGITPIPRLTWDPDERSEFILKASATLSKHEEFDAQEATDAFNDLMKGVVTIERPYTGTRSARRKLHETSSVLISRFVDETEVDANGRLHIPGAVWHEVNMLKQLTWHYVINSPDLATIQEGQKEIVSDLFDILSSWMEREETTERLPTRLRETLKSIKDDPQGSSILEDDPARLRARATADYIASLTEPQAVELYGRLKGTDQPSVLHAWVRTQ